MKPTNKDKGDFGEDIAQNYLKKNGYKILDTNWRYSKFSELDIVAKKSEILVFVEVKFRSSNKCGTPFEAINYEKLNHLKTAILAYLQNTKEKYNSYQLDIIGITGKENPQIEHLKNIEL